MPRLGMTMTEGKVLEWPVPPGGRVEKGRTVVIIESEKAEAEVEATASGTLRHIYVEPDPERALPCGTLLAALTDTPDEPFDAEAFRREHDRPQIPAAAPLEVPVSGRSAEPRAPAGGAHATPAARALARKHGIDLAAVAGSGPGGRVTREDVAAWLAGRADRVEVAEGVRLEVPTAGEGEPVLLLPGFGADVSVFARQSPALAERYRVLGVNPRGVGLSDAPEASAYDVEQAADDAARVTQGPAHVVGASLGAAVAVELALRHPGRVRSLALVTPFLAMGARGLAVIDAWCRVAERADAEVLARALLPWLFSDSFLADERARERTARGLAEMAGRVPPAVLRRSASGLRAWSGTRREALGAIAAPTLVLVAGGDLLVPEGEALGDAIPAAVTVVVPEAGHALGLEAPEAVNEALLAHLEAAGGDRAAT
jgi:pimeloyl-ACP methyl ester carboxylesterase